MPSYLEVCGGKERIGFLVFLVKNMWWINKKLGSLLFLHLRPGLECSFFHHIIFWNATLTWKLWDVFFWWNRETICKHNDPMKRRSKTRQMLPLAQHRKTCQVCNTRSCAEAALSVFFREERARGADAAPAVSFLFEDNNFQRGCSGCLRGCHPPLSAPPCHLCAGEVQGKCLWELLPLTSATAR